MPVLARTIGRWSFPICGAVALLVVLGGGAPAARAACGDYVTVIRPGDPPTHDPARGHQPGVPGCHGPSCSVPPTQAAPVPAPKLIDRPTLDLSADPTRPDAESPRRADREPGSHFAPAPLTADIFHPPRAR